VDWHLWLMFTLTEGVLTMTPGPAVLFVVSQGLRSGTGGALDAALGILATNALYFALSATSVGTLLAASAGLFTAVKWAGAAYLLYLGATALLRPSHLSLSESTPERGAPFLRGFVLQASNPKALLFFVAVLPQFLDRGRPIFPQILVLGMTSILLELAVLSSYGAMAARAGGRFAMRPRLATATSRLGGLLLVGASLGLMRLDP
jgi:homoserine/homoserine lactone efflux protein